MSTEQKAPIRRHALIGRIPKGFRIKAQGCEGRATLGKRAWCFTTLKGLRPHGTAVVVGRNPFRVVIDRTRDPRLARSSRPWALLRNPFGILSRITAEDMLRAKVRVFQNAESGGFTTRAATNHRSVRGHSGAREADGMNCPSGFHPPDLRTGGCVV